MRSGALLRRVLASLALSGLVLPTGRAQSMAVDADLQVTLIFKILTYDRQLEARTGADLVVGIVHDPRDHDSAVAADQIASTLYKFRDKKVKEIAIRYFLIEYTSPRELEAFVAQKGVDLLYITPGSTKFLCDVLRISRAQHKTTATGVPEYVRRGVGVGVGRGQDRTQILVNLPGSRAEGSEFDASFLRLATVINSGECQ
jgi:hypothetical protein